MRCPKCKFISFDFLEKCKKCGTSLAEIRYSLCPLVFEPANESIWQWLGVGGSVVEDIGQTFEVQQDVLAESFEIKMDGADEIILDESFIVEEEESPAEIILEAEDLKIEEPVKVEKSEDAELVELLPLDSDLETEEKDILSLEIEKPVEKPPLEAKDEEEDLDSIIKEIELIYSDESSSKGSDS